MRGGIFFHPSNEDLSLGTRLRKMPPGIELSVKGRIETAADAAGGDGDAFHGFSNAVRADEGSL
jgi:hypothetical protein